MSETQYGRYTVVDRIGQGGMSVVHRAIDPALDRTVALKVMHPHLAERPESRARFSREARAVARLRHPHIVEVYDYAPPESEQAYIVTEFIDGPTLRDFAEEHPVRHPEVAALLVLPIVEALAQAHGHGIIHRDVKPENIMIRPDGSPVLMDFGIAQMVDTETLTATGTVLGSPAHMAPEVIDGEEIGAPADVFSVGTVLYWLVCGALPFTASNPSALFRRILECRFDPVQQRRPHAGRQIARIIESCLALEITERPTAPALAERLRAMLAAGGLTDPAAEQRAFFADPSVYQDELGRRLIPLLVDRAQRAWRNRKSAIALDLLDRVLALDEHQPEAQALLERIERGMRVTDRLRLAAALAALLVVAALVYWLWPKGDGPVIAASERGALASLIGAVTGEPLEQAGGLLGLAVRRGDPTAGDAPGPAAAPDAAVPDAMPPDAARPDAARPDASGDAARPSASVDAGVPDASAATVANRRRTRRRDRRPPPPTPVVEPPVVVAEPVNVRLHGQHKGAKVFINGEDRGYLFRLEATGGVKLPPGEHTIRFTNPGCADMTRTIRIAAGAARGPAVVFECAHLPATVRVEGPPGMTVRRSDGSVVGYTNQDIEIGMQTLQSRLSLTVGTPGDRVVRRMLELTAGKREILQISETDF